MRITFSSFCKQILFLVLFIHTEFCKVYAEEYQEKQNKLIEELHSMYKDAYENEKTYLSRRLFSKDGNSHYTLHVQKLKEVNGIKTHNLRVEGRSKPDAPFIYINNPVEAGMPNPYFSIDEFKNLMLERGEKQKKEFDLKRQIILKANKQYRATHLNNFTDKIFNVKKHTELVIKNSSGKPMKTTLYKGKNNLNKKRKQKDTSTQNFKPVQFVKPTSSHLMITTSLPEAIVDEEITTETVVDEEITTETVVVEEITTETVVDEEINTETVVDEVNTTESTPYEETTIESVADENVTTQSAVTTDPATVVETTTKSTTGDQITKESTPHNQNTNRSSTDNQMTTESTAAYQNTTVTATEHQNKTESTADIPTTTTETVTEKKIITQPATTTSTTVRTTRTKQLRPYVFMGNMDKVNNNNNY